MDSGVWIVVIAALTAVNVACVIVVVRALRIPSGRKVTPHYHLDVSTTDILKEEELDKLRNEALDKLQVSSSDTLNHFDEKLMSFQQKMYSELEDQFSKTSAIIFDNQQKITAEAAATIARSVSQSAKVFEENAQRMNSQLESTIAAEKKRRLELFESNMASVITQYMSEVFDGNEDMAAQAPVVINWLGKHKEAIKKDIL